MTRPPNDLRTAVADERSGLLDYAGEATGFGVIEMRTFRDLLLRPRRVLDTYLMKGPTGGGRYARPAGFYIALCGVLMFYLFLVDGLKGLIEQQPAEALTGWIAQSGKTREAFINDADNWMSFVGVPILSIFYALGAAPLLKWWGGLDWRRTLRATFALLCAWTVPILLLGPLPIMKGYEIVGSIFMWGALFVAFLRMGRGLWFKNWISGIFKMLALSIALALSVIVGMIAVFNIALLGALHGS